MNIKRGQADYNAFMGWFEKTYPDMYKSHKETILVPLSGEGVTVDEDSMNQETYRKIIAITKEYYENEAHSS